MESVEKTLVNAFVRTKKTFSCAESCTGGLISKKITDISGASEMFLGGVVSYANDVKARVLGVSEEALKNVGAVSKEVAAQMALGVMKLMSSDYAVSVTGIAGPGGGTDKKLVGLVYIAAASKEHSLVYVTENHFSGSREEVREKTAIRALNMAMEIFESGKISGALEM